MTLDCGVLDKLDHVDTVLADRGFAIQSDLLLPPPASGLGQRYLFMLVYSLTWANDTAMQNCYVKQVLKTKLASYSFFFFFVIVPFLLLFTL